MWPPWSRWCCWLAVAPARGLNTALVALLTNLVAGGLVAFYAAQFTALTSTVLVVLQLGLVLDLRIRTSRASVDEAAGLSPRLVTCRRSPSPHNLRSRYEHAC